jgi:ABC-2 type transport system ATP-binding protein
MNDLHPAGFAVEARKVTYSYGSVQALRGIDLVVPSGETVALLGANGAGKSTLIDTILGLTRPREGRVSLFGRTPTDAVRLGLVGGMLQSGMPLDYLKVRELLALMASYYPHSLPVDEVLDLTGIRDLGGRWTSKLSGGQAQRVRFATALVGDADLLVLDEPTAAIDIQGRRAFWGTMRTVVDCGKTVLFATHSLEEADSFADRIVVLAHGRIVADGTPTEIKAMSGTSTIRATLPMTVDLATLDGLPGVTTASRRGTTVTLSCADSDAALAALYRSCPEVRGVEVTTTSLESALVKLEEAEPSADVERTARLEGATR